MLSLNGVVYLIIFNIPPQMNGGGTSHEFVFEQKRERSSQWFSKHISKIVLVRYKSNTKITVKNYFSNKVIIHLDMLGTSIKHWIGSKSNGKDIVTPKN